MPTINSKDSSIAVRIRKEINKYKKSIGFMLCVKGTSHSGILTLIIIDWKFQKNCWGCTKEAFRGKPNK